MRRLLSVLFLFLLLTQAPLTALAWNKPGHMAVAAIAYRELKDADPQALKRAIALLKQHPFYEDVWKPAIEDLNVNDPDKEGLYLFMWAARWPDDIRDDPDLHCELCHFINFPFKPPGQPNSIQTQQPAQENVISAFQRNVGILQSNSSPAVRAMALSWILHLVGDVHQPLHTTALFTTKFSHGDRGGTIFFIRVQPTSSTISLHKLWDGFILGSDRFQSVNSKATELRSRPEFRRSALGELSETNFSKWASVESFNAAKRIAYRDGQLQGSNSSSNGVALPSDYVAGAKPVAERRAVVAGYRLSDLLSGWF
jgi:hypothetical protein